MSIISSRLVKNRGLLMDTRTEIVSKMSTSYTKTENRIFNKALNLHLNLTEDLSSAALIWMQDRIKIEVWPKDHKKVYLDNLLICEIFPLTFEVDGTILNNNFQYRIYPKEGSK